MIIKLIVDSEILEVLMGTIIKMGCEYRSECIAKDLDCFFGERRFCKLRDMVLDQRKQREYE